MFRHKWPECGDDAGYAGSNSYDLPLATIERVALVESRRGCVYGVSAARSLTGTPARDNGETQAPCGVGVGGAGMDRVVSPDGAEGNDGSVANPWPLQKGLDEVQPGDVLYLRGGTYVGRVTLNGKLATPASPVVIRSFPEEHAVIDGTLEDFLEAPNAGWEGPFDHDEYISVELSHVATATRPADRSMSVSLTPG